MKLEVNRRQLLEAVKRGRKFQDKELAKHPVYEAVELSAEHGDLRVTTAGNFLWYEATMPADIERDGVAIVSASALEMLLKASSRLATVSLSMAGRKLVVGLGQNATAKLESATAHLEEGDSRDGLPPIPDAVRDGGTVLLDSQFPTLQRILGKVAHVVPDPKEGMAVTRLNVGSRAVSAVGFDRCRIARAAVPCGSGRKRDIERPILIAQEVVARLLGLKSEAAVRLIEADGYVALAIGAAEFTVFRPLELSNYPDLDAIDAKNTSEKRGVFDRVELLRAAESVAAVMISGTAAAIESTGTVSAVSETCGSVRIEVPIRATGEWVVGLNPTFLIDALRAIDSSEVELEVADQLFARFRPAVSSRATELQEELVMAMKTKPLIKETAAPEPEA